MSSSWSLLNRSHWGVENTTSVSGESSSTPLWSTSPSDQLTSTTYMDTNTISYFEQPCPGSSSGQSSKPYDESYGKKGFGLLPVMSEDASGFLSQTKNDARKREMKVERKIEGGGGLTSSPSSSSPSSLGSSTTTAGGGEASSQFNPFESATLQQSCTPSSYSNSYGSGDVKSVYRHHQLDHYYGEGTDDGTTSNPGNNNNPFLQSSSPSSNTTLFSLSNEGLNASTSLDKLEDHPSSLGTTSESSPSAPFSPNEGQCFAPIYETDGGSNSSGSGTPLGGGGQINTNSQINASSSSSPRQLPTTLEEEGKVSAQCCRGVYFDHIRHLWRANWPEETVILDRITEETIDVRRCTRTKGFSAKKYGFLESQKLAIAHRARMISSGSLRHYVYMDNNTAPSGGEGTSNSQHSVGKRGSPSPNTEQCSTAASQATNRKRRKMRGNSSCISSVVESGRCHLSQSSPLRHEGDSPSSPMSNPNDITSAPLLPPQGTTQLNSGNYQPTAFPFESSSGLNDLAPLDPVEMPCWAWGSDSYSHAGPFAMENFEDGGNFIYRELNPVIMPATPSGNAAAGGNIKTKGSSLLQGDCRSDTT